MDAIPQPAFKLNLGALPHFDFDAQDASPCGADTDFFLATSSPSNALNEMAYTWPTADEADNLGELDSLFTTSSDSAPQVGVAKLVLPPEEPSMDELRDFTAVLMTPPRKSRPAKRKLFSDDDMEARYCQRKKLEAQSPQSPASPLTHYSRQRLEIAELTQVAEALERELKILRASKAMHGFAAYERALKSKADLLEAQEANMRLKHQVQGHLRQRQQLETIAFGEVLGGSA